MNSGVSAQKTTPQNNKTVGVLIDSANSYFNKRAIGDLIDAADEKGLHLVFFFGGALEREKTIGPYSYAYTLPHSDTIDALIILPHSIAPYSPSTNVSAIAKQFSSIPVYSLCSHLPGYFSIWAHGSEAIDQMISHLVEDHNYKKFAVLCGPDAAESVSRKRLEAIEKRLKARNIELRSEFIFHGTFTVDDGRKTARQILSAEGDSPEVLICLNDQMAIGAVSEFVNNGIAVPEDIAIVGFDDIEENTTLPCPLTTIDFPIWEMVTQLVARIESDLSGKTTYTSDTIVLDGKFMHRESCGCTSWLEKNSSKNSRFFVPLGENTVSHSALKKAAILRRTLEDIVEECIATNDTDNFQNFIRLTIQSLARSGDLTAAFTDAFSTQWMVTLLRHPEFEKQNLINSLFIDAFRLLMQTKTNFFARMHADDMGILNFYQKCNDLLALKTTSNDALLAVASNIPQLGIERCQLVFISPDNPETGELRLNFKKDSFTEIPQGNFISFPVKQLVNSGIHSVRGHIAVMTVAHNNTVYGYLVLSIQEKHFEHFSMIQDLFSQIIASSIANDLLSNHIQNLTQKNTLLSRLSVIDEFTGLYNRRALYVTGRMMYEKAQEEGETCCFIFIDMDGLKTINDTYGHKEGDTAILSLSTILKKSFREKDLVIRYGGDEFVVLMTNIQEKNLHMALNRISRQIDEFNEKKQYSWKLSASWGFVFNDASSPPKSFESIIEESDARLYEQKRMRKKTQGDSIPSHKSGL
jgi:diguanylate cyclase (GGDEF)-like protein